MMQRVTKDVTKIKGYGCYSYVPGLKFSCVHHALAAMSTASSLSTRAGPCRQLPHTPEMGNTMCIL